MGKTSSNTHQRMRERTSDSIYHRNSTVNYYSHLLEKNEAVDVSSGVFNTIDLN